MHGGPEFTIVLLLSVTLVIGAALKALARRTGIPYSIALLLTGCAVGTGAERLPDAGAIGAGLHALASGADLSPDLILFVFLPVLVFESAFALRVHAFARNLGPVIVLAVPALLASTVAIGALMVWITPQPWNWTWAPALVFGALISATDPVAVVALLRDLGAPKRLSLLIEGESLLNDGTAIVVFGVLLGVLTGSAELDVAAALAHFVVVTGGGIAVGLVLAIAVSRWLEGVFNAPLIEITLTIVLAYLCMLVAEGMLHVSGVMAIVVAGLWLAGPARTAVSPEVTHFLHRFWGMLAYLANTLIFFLVGIVIATRVHAAEAADLLVVLGAFVGVVLVRVVLLLGARPLMNRLAEPVSRPQVMVMAWGGLRGAVSLALALIVHQHLEIDAALRDQILLVTVGVVASTIVVNGSTMGPLLRHYGFDQPPPGDRLVRDEAEVSVLDRVDDAVAGVSRGRTLRTVNWGVVHHDLAARRTVLERRIAADRDEIATLAPAERQRGFWRQVLAMEREALWRAFGSGLLGPRAVQILDHEIDLELDRLARGASRPHEIRRPRLPVWRERLARLRKRPGAALNRLQFELVALRYDLCRGVNSAARSVLAELPELTAIEPDVREELQDVYRATVRASQEQLEDLRTQLPEVTRAIETRLARRVQLNYEREGYRELAATGAIDDVAAEAALASVERRMLALRHLDRRMELPDTTDLCRDAPLFAGLDDAALAQIAALTAERVLAPGETLFEQGDRGDSMYIVARGALEVVRADRGVSTVLDVLGGGDFVGEMALLTDAPRTATVRALTTVTLGGIARAGFEHLMADQPRLRCTVWDTFARRSLDNYLPRRPAFRAMGHAARMAWFDRGRLHEVAAGDRVPVRAGTFAFLVAGALDAEGACHLAPALLEIASDTDVKASKPSWVLLLPPPA